MHKLFFVAFLLLIPFLPMGAAYGFESQGQDCTKCHTLNDEEARDILKGIFRNITKVDIRMSPVKAFWEVFLEWGGKKGIVYVDFSKRYFITGSMISIKERKNLTQERLTELNRIDASKIPLDDALVMGDQKARIRVIAFDDPD